MFRELVKNYLQFSKKERFGILIFLALIVLIFLLPNMVFNNVAPVVTLDSALMGAIKTLNKPDSSFDDFKYYRKNIYYKYPDSKFNYLEEYVPSNSATVFNFDPNNISLDDWKKLGLKEKTYSTMQKYFSKGGKIKTAEDFKKLYGVSEDDYNRLSPYIVIENAAPKFADTLAVVPQNIYQPKKYSNVLINSCDTTELKTFPGIGSKMASRIIVYKNKLGGFYNVEQLKEVFGLPDSVFQKIKNFIIVEPNKISKININKATFDELKNHPYIRYANAKIIIAYREEHGNFSSVEDLKNIMALSAADIAKFSPYLEY